MSKRTMSQTSDDNEALMVGTNFKVGRKLGAGNFGELRLGNYRSIFKFLCGKQR